MKLDIVIPVKTSLVQFVIEKTIPSIIENLSFNNIYLITCKENFSKLSILKSSTIIILDEDSIISGLEIKYIRNYLYNKGQDINRAGWYFQQFIKLGLSTTKYINNRYLVWDADNIALRKINFFSNEGEILCDTTKENYATYFLVNEKLIGLKKQVNFSFISEHFIFETEKVKELLNKISINTNNCWWKQILDSIPENQLSSSGFSEYELYGNYITKYHKNSFKIRKLSKSRRGTHLLGINPSKFSLSFFSIVFDYMSFEEWQKKCEPLPLRYFKISKTFIKAFSRNLFSKQTR